MINKARVKRALIVFYQRKGIDVYDPAQREEMMGLLDAAFDFLMSQGLVHRSYRLMFIDAATKAFAQTFEQHKQ